MIHTIVAFERDESREKIADMLEKAGIQVRFRCKSGAEVIRCVKLMGGGVVVCGYKLADMSADHLAFDTQGSARLLVLAKPAQLALCENPELFKLPLPISSGELRGSVSILLQMDALRVKPRRTEEENELINEAKKLLMRRDGLTEPEAHKYLQRRSMETATKLPEMAKYILLSEEQR